MVAVPAGLDGNPNPVVTPARTGMLASIVLIGVDNNDLANPRIVATR
jgi:hypothetical protein